MQVVDNDLSIAYPCSGFSINSNMPFNLLWIERIVASMLCLKTLQPGESNCDALLLTYIKMSFEDRGSPGS